VLLIALSSFTTLIVSLRHTRLGTRMSGCRLLYRLHLVEPCVRVGRFCTATSRCRQLYRVMLMKTPCSCCRQQVHGHARLAWWPSVAHDRSACIVQLTSPNTEYLPRVSVTQRPPTGSLTVIRHGGGSGPAGGRCRRRRRGDVGGHVER